MAKPFLRLVGDPVEKCRELAIETVDGFVESVSNPMEFFPLIFPVIVARIGKEPVQASRRRTRLPALALSKQAVPSTPRKAQCTRRPAERTNEPIT